MPRSDQNLLETQFEDALCPSCRARRCAKGAPGTSPANLHKEDCARWLDLAQRRLLPRRRRQLVEILESPIELRAVWETFEGDLTALRHLANEGLGRIVDAIRRVCTTSRGRAAVAAGLRSIEVENVKDPVERGAFLRNEILHVRLALGYGWRGALTEDEIAESLEEQLAEENEKPYRNLAETPSSDAS